MMVDGQHIHAYARDGDQAAFRRIVADHINLVYSAARRQVRDPHLAEDITQVVFAILARKAKTIACDAVLPGWLFQTTRYVAGRMRLAAQRRAKHEREAAAMLQASVNPDRTWKDVEPWLDEGLAQLGRGDRDALLLRYFQGMSLRATGEALGITENTAAKRISRALERLRGFFSRRGISVGAPAIAVMLADSAVEAAPAVLAESVLAGASSLTGPLAAAADQAIHALVVAKVKALVAVAASVAVVGTAGLIALLQWTGRPGPAAPAAAPVVAPAPSTPVFVPPAPIAAAEIRRSWDAKWNAYPIAAGWPVALPGEVTGTPALADLDGDGDLEVLVPAMYRGEDNPATRPAVESLASSNSRPMGLRHPAPTLAATLWAFHHDGTLVRGWPAVLLDEAGRRRDRVERPNYCENWAASPTAADLDGDGRDEVIITAPAAPIAGAGRSFDRTFILNGDGSRRLFPEGIVGGEVWSSFPVADVDGDGRPDLVNRNIGLRADGSPVPGWRPQQPLDRCFAPCIGDANGDGRVEVYFCTYIPNGMMVGLDATGRMIPGWPQEVTRQCLFPPVMGDVDGDGKMEVFAADQGGHLLGWRWNGKALLPGRTADGMAGVFKEMSVHGSPTLADLDGDGRAEVIAYNGGRLMAWRGDGTGFCSDDGLVVRVEGRESYGPVTVADLGGDGVMDLFVAGTWVQLGKGRPAQCIALVPESLSAPAGVSVADVDRDGEAELVLGGIDGQVVIYRTGKSFAPALAQWPSPNGKRHAGVWRRSRAQ